MHYLPKPIRLQIELSNVCNAKCLHCKRNELDFSTLETMLENNINVSMDNLPVKTSEDYKTKQHLPVDLITKLLKDAPSIKELYLCGSIDDPLGYKHLLELFENIVTDKPNMFIGVHTNGSMRNPAFFLEWGKILKKTNHSIWFSIDGLEDTNHLYRQNVNWKRCMENSSAFISSGGRARWEFIVFEHNQHQIQEAKILAKKMGFEDFRTKKTGRFFSTVKHEGKEEHQGVNRKGEQTQKLQKPNDEYINCLLYTSPSPRDRTRSRMPSSA